MLRFCTNFVGQIVFDGRLSMGYVRQRLSNAVSRVLWPSKGERRLSFTEMGKTAGGAE